ncbi:hypothetical protein F4808DRAFT_404869 [Astrocystis sublimbata]|nr:hypothetical protein F4808DRAFT_404869 [Astrocystis sublimbata]
MLPSLASLPIPPSSHSMYGIIAFNNKGEQSASSEFRAEPKKYGRGMACQGCRIARVKCSGKLDGSDCERCKGLEVQCRYTNAASRGKRRDNTSTRDNTATSTRSASPKPAKDSLPSPVPRSPTLEIPNYDEPHLMPDNSFGFDFDMWLPMAGVQDPVSVVEPFGLGAGPPADSILTPPYTEPRSLPSVPSEKLLGTGENWDIHLPQLSVKPQQGLADSESLSTQMIPGLLGHENDLAGLIYPCSCHQATTSCLSMLRGWSLGERPGAGLDVNDGGSALSNRAVVEDFLALFEKSIEQLQMIENCPQGCIVSQDLAILLLLAVEQLAKLLLSLASDFAGGSLQSHDEISLRKKSPAAHLGEDASCGGAAEPGTDKRVSRIGTFEIRDPLDLKKITQLLLQIRTQTLDAYICRWADKIKHFGLHNLQFTLGNIREDLNKVKCAEKLPC